MSTWVIISWVFVLILTGVNIFIFLKLKGASEQMLKTAFPGAKNMNEALGQMQKMMGNLQGMQAIQKGKGGRGRQQRVQQFGGAAALANDPKLKAAMEMLQKMQQQKGRKS